MKKIINIFACLIILGGAIGFSSCDDDDTYVYNVSSVKIAGIEGDVLPILIGYTHQVEVEFGPKDAANIADFKFAYTSGDETVFTVNDKGLLTAVGEGSTTLTVQAENDPTIKAVCMVISTEEIFKVSSIKLSEYLANGLTISQGVKVDLIKETTVLPENATVKTFVVGSSNTDVAIVDEDGVTLTMVGNGTSTITLTAIDGSNEKASFVVTVKDLVLTNLDRTGWLVDTSHDTVADAQVGGGKEALVDDDTDSCMSLRKAGKSGVPKEDIIFFTIDMQKEVEFEAFKLRHRTKGNSNVVLRVQEVSVYGSNDGITYDLIQAGNAIATDVTEVAVPFTGKVKYRYFKMTYDKWITASGNTMQISDFNICTVAYAD